jgi:hypothetical protein
MKNTITTKMPMNWFNCDSSQSLVNGIDLSSMIGKPFKMESETKEPQVLGQIADCQKKGDDFIFTVELNDYGAKWLADHNNALWPASVVYK